jgi:hypothetical protein
MRSATPLFEKMTLDEYLAVGKQWGAKLGEDEWPFEGKVSDWRWYDGRRVALDHSTPAWGNDQPRDRRPLAASPVRFQRQAVTRAPQQLAQSRRRFWLS